MINYWHFAWLTLAHMSPRENQLWKYICVLKPENQLFVEFNDLKSSMCSNPCAYTAQMFEIVGVWSFDQYISQLWHDLRKPDVMAHTKILSIKHYKYLVQKRIS